MIRPDRFDTRPPKVHECTPVELIDFLRVAQRVPLQFTEWERGFCASIHPLRLTPRQVDTLNRGLLRKLWDRDPDLWT